MERYQRKKERRKRFFFKNVFSTNLLSNYMLIYARLRVKAYYYIMSNESVCQGSVKDL